MLKDLIDAAESISMESASMAAPSPHLNSKVATLLDNAGDFLNKSILAPIAMAFGPKDLGWMALKIKSVDYADIRTQPVCAPDGFVGNFAEYSAELHKAVVIMQDLEKDVLAPFAAWISNCLENPSALASLSSNLRIPGLKDPNYDKLEKRLDRFFPENGQGKELLYQDVIARQGDWAILNDNVKKINALYQQDRFQSVRVKVGDTTQLLNTLVTRLMKEEDYRMSSVVIDQLTKTTVRIAELVEFYGLLRHRSAEFQQSLQQTIEDLRPSM